MCGHGDGHGCCLGERVRRGKTRVGEKAERKRIDSVIKAILQTNRP